MFAQEPLRGCRERLNASQHFLYNSRVPTLSLSVGRVGFIAAQCTFLSTPDTENQPTGNHFLGNTPSEPRPRQHPFASSPFQTFIDSRFFATHLKNEMQHQDDAAVAEANTIPAV